MSYLGKVGPYASEEIRRDRRMRPDASGGTTLREPETWVEAHEVLVESEKLKRGTGAFSRFTGGANQPEHPSGGGKFGGKGDRNGKGKGKDGKHSQDRERSEHPTSRVRGACFNMRDKGHCQLGDSSRF